MKQKTLPTCDTVVFNSDPEATYFDATGALKRVQCPGCGSSHVSTYRFLVSCRHESGEPVIRLPVRDYTGKIQTKDLRNAPTDLTLLYIFAVVILIALVLSDYLGRVALIMLLYLLQHHWRRHKTDVKKWESTFHCAECYFTFEKQFHKVMQDTR